MNCIVLCNIYIEDHQCTRHDSNLFRITSCTAKEMLRATREKFPNFTILAVMNFWQLENKEFTKSYDIYQPNTHHFEISEVLDLPFLNFLV